MICGHTTGCPDCQDRDCRRLWMVGSTTGEHYRPAPLRSLIVDVLETWRGRWFTEQEIAADIHRLRPRIYPETVDRVCERVRKAGGAEVAGMWVTVVGKRLEPDPFSTSTDSLGWALIVPQQPLS